MKNWLAGWLLLAVLLTMVACTEGGSSSANGSSGGAAAAASTTGDGGSSGATTTAPPPTDDSYDRAVAAIAEKQYAKAFRLLKTSADHRAPALLEKFDYVMTSAKHSGENVTYTLDENGFMVKAEYRSGMSSVYTYTYDAAGRVLTENMSENGGSYTTEKTYTYENGRLLQTDYSDSYGSWVKEVYTYDAAGRCTKQRVTQSYSDENSTTTYTYDAAGRMLTEDVQVENGSFRTHTYTYNAQGQLTKQTVDYASDRTLYTYTYDAQGRLATETVTGYGACAMTYTYNGDGLRSGRVMTVGDITYTQTISYDEYRCLTKVTSKASNGSTGNVTVTYSEDGTKCTKKSGGETEQYVLRYYPDGVPASMEWLTLYGGWIRPNFE